MIYLWLIAKLEGPISEINVKTKLQNCMEEKFKFSVSISFEAAPRSYNLQYSSTILKGNNGEQGKLKEVHVNYAQCQ